jgi:NAD+ kinase
MKIALHGRNFKEEVRPIVRQMFEQLAEQQVEIQLSEVFAAFLQKVTLLPPDPKIYRNRSEIFDADFVFSIGGDGTLLEVVSQVGSRQIPIVGINTGRLGFLATTSPEQIKPNLEYLFAAAYTIDQRSLIRVESDREVFEDGNFGLNEFTIARRDTSSMITVDTYIDGEYLNSYWADGLIVATPTGSTGYALSCGGPLVLPQSGNFIIAPISPHNLNVRPMIVSDKSVISFEIQGRSKNYLISLDSRSKVVDATIQLAVRKETFPAHLVRFDGDNFLDTLRQKLNWGLDKRN